MLDAKETVQFLVKAKEYIRPPSACYCTQDGRFSKSEGIGKLSSCYIGTVVDA